MSLFFQDSTGGSAIDTIQTISSATSTTATAWSSTVQTAFTAPGQTLSAAAISAADVGKTVTIVNTGANAFTLAQTGGSITSAIGLTVSPGATCALKAVSTTASIVVGTNSSQNAIGEFGSQSFATSGQQTLTTTVADLNQSAFTLPSAGTWKVTYTAHTFSVSNANLTTYIADTLNNIIANSIGQCNESSASQSFIPITKTVYITTTGSTNYKLRGISSVAATGGILANDTALRSNTINWTKISGFTPVTGQSVDYVEVIYSNTSSTNLTATDHVKYDTIIRQSGSGITPDVSTAYTSTAGVNSLGRFLLQPNKVYQLEGNIGDINASANGNWISYNWYNADTNTVITNGVGGSTMLGNNLSNTTPGRDTATTSFAPTVATRVELRITGNGSVTQYGGGFNSNRATARITQIGTSATTTTTRVNVICRNKTAQSLVGTSWNVLTNWTEVQDPTNSFDPVTGTFTAPRAGTYQFSTGNGAPIVNAGVYIGQCVFKNNTTQFYNLLISAVSTAIQYIQTSGTIEMNAGETLQARTYNGGSVNNDNPSVSNSWFTITEINPTF